MEKIGIKKKVDKLGRISIPVEIRRLFNFESEVELQITKEGVLIKNPEYIFVKKDEHKI